MCAVVVVCDGDIAFVVILYVCECVSVCEVGIIIFIPFFFVVYTQETLIIIMNVVIS